jgi:hypothetical protein
MKNAIAQETRRLFDSPATLGGDSGDVTALGAERHVEPLRKFGYELSISIRLGTAQPVMHVHSGEHETRLRERIGHRYKQCHGVRASRHSYSHALPRMKGVSCPSKLSCLRLWFARCHRATSVRASLLVFTILRYVYGHER